MAKLRGGDPQFTYDFGLAVSTQTISRLTRLTGATLSLAGAYYALQKTSSEYMDTLRSNSLRFGGYLNTMRAISEAQDRIIKGATRYSVKDQLKGLNDLMAVGLDARKEFDLVNKSAHALGVEFSDFAGAISNGIRGNMSALVQMGLLTERSVRYFEKYPANTIMRQQAILKFVKEHKGLQSLIKNDFKTIADETSRISTIWKVFLKSIVGDPRNPDSLYGSVVRAFGGIADGLKGYMEYIKRAGYMIGRVLGWVVRQVGKFVQWLGRTTAHAFRGVKDVLDNYKDATASIIVWLEFWKQRIVKFFKDYQEPIKTTLKLLIAYKALKSVFVISRAAIASAWAYSTALYGGMRSPFVRAKWRTGRMIVNRRQQGSLVKQGIGKGSWGRRWMYLKNMFIKPVNQTRISAVFGFIKRIGNLLKGPLKILTAIAGTFKVIRWWNRGVLGKAKEWDESMSLIKAKFSAIGTIVKDSITRNVEKMTDALRIFMLDLSTGWKNFIFEFKKVWAAFENSKFYDILGRLSGHGKYDKLAAFEQKVGVSTNESGRKWVDDKLAGNEERNKKQAENHVKQMNRLEESRVLNALATAKNRAYRNSDVEDLRKLATELGSKYEITINAPEGMDANALSSLIISKIEDYEDARERNRSSRSGKD